MFRVLDTADRDRGAAGGGGGGGGGGWPPHFSPQMQFFYGVPRF